LSRQLFRMIFFSPVSQSQSFEMAIQPPYSIQHCTAEKWNLFFNVLLPIALEKNFVNSFASEKSIRERL